MVLIFAISAVLLICTFFCGRLLFLSLPKQRFADKVKAENAAKESRSKASQKLIEAFDALPAESRPFGREELLATLEALDFKHGIEYVNTHFTYFPSWSMYTGPYFEWDCGHNFNYNSLTERCAEEDNYQDHICDLKDYIAFNDAIEAVSTALANREEALAKANHRAELAGRQISIDKVSILTQRLRDEAAVLNDVAKELV